MARPQVLLAHLLLQRTEDAVRDLVGLDVRIAEHEVEGLHLLAHERVGPVELGLELGLANATSFGLASYAFTRDVGRVQRLMDELETGMVGINTGVVSNPAAPFGGVKHSGLGREGGAHGIDAYLEPVYSAVPLG